MKRITFGFLLLLVLVGSAQPSHERLQSKLDSLRTIGNFPGLSISIVDKEGKAVILR